MGFGDIQAAPALMSTLSVASTVNPTEGAKPSHTYDETGTYTVTLWVTDDEGSKTSAQAQVLVNNAPTVDVKVRFAPRRLHLSSKAKYVWAKVVFPKDYNAFNVDDSSIKVVAENGAVLSAQMKKRRFWSRFFKRFKIRKRSIFVKFDRQALLASLDCPPAKRISLTVKGKIFHDNQWVEFNGARKIRIKMRKNSICREDKY